MGIDRLTIDHSFAMAPIVIEIAHPFAWYLGCSHESREEMRACPNLRSQTIFRNSNFGSNGSS
jgi:hypothetical protein